MVNASVCKWALNITSSEPRMPKSSPSVAYDGQTRWREEILQARTRPWPKALMTRMPTRDRFAVV